MTLLEVVFREFTLIAAYRMSWKMPAFKEVSHFIIIEL